MRDLRKLLSANQVMLEFYDPETEAYFKGPEIELDLQTIIQELKQP